MLIAHKMKIITIFFFVLVTSLLIGINISGKTSTSKPSVVDDFKKLSGRTQVLAFETLHSEEKCEFWIAKLKYHLSNEQFSPRQVALLGEVLSILKPEVFVNESVEQLTFKKAYITRFLPAALNMLGKSNTNRLFVNMSFDVSDSTKVKEVEKQSCNCNIRTDRANGGCMEKHGADWKCAGSNCNEKGLGCGWFGLYRCDGMCQKMEG